MKKILFLANHVLTLYNFRKEMVVEMLNLGHEVYLSIPMSEECTFFENLGCNIVPTHIDRRGLNPIKDIKLLCEYRKILRDISPDIIFSFTIKPNIYGSMVSNLMGLKQICNITGIGTAFIKDGLLNKLCTFLYKISVKKCYKVFFQNKDDCEFFISKKIVGNTYEVLPGSGCNIEENQFKSMPSDDIIKFIFIGRVMKSKGIYEYIKCAQAIKKSYPNTMFYIAGWNEELELKQLVEDAQSDGYVEYLGYRKDIKKWIESCHCTILPSYSEGMPNVLLESSAIGRVCIASRISGCKDAVDDGVTGYLFEVGNANDLIDKVNMFLNLSSMQREEMGRAGRKKIEMQFDRKIVVGKYLAELL